MANHGQNISLHSWVSGLNIQRCRSASLPQDGILISLRFPGKALKFIADGYSAYPPFAQQFKIEKDWDVFITQVIGLTNDDEVSRNTPPVQRLIERLNRTFESIALPVAMVQKMAPSQRLSLGCITISYATYEKSVVKNH